jgi:transposase
LEPLSDFSSATGLAAAPADRYFTTSHKKHFALIMFSDILKSLWNSINRVRTMETAAQGILTRDEMESRRLSAAEDLQRGLSQSQVARKFGVSRTTASRWHRALDGNGVEALRKRRAPGRPSRLSAEQLRGAAEIYKAGPRAAGFDSDRWTTARFAEAIYARFAIRYDPDHVGRIMHRLGLRERTRTRRRVADVLYASRYSSAPILSRAEISPTVA